MKTCNFIKFSSCKDTEDYIWPQSYFRTVMLNLMNSERYLLKYGKKMQNALFTPFKSEIYYFVCNIGKFKTFGRFILIV